MELGRFSGHRSKAQLMTIVVLIMFLLMLAELFVFALLNVGSNSIAQSLAVSSSSNNYAALLKLSANNFAKDSLGRAIATLASYESMPSVRKTNLIPNVSAYLGYLVINGVLPNDTLGYPQNAMGNLTLKSYNGSVARLIGYTAQNVIVNESMPNVFQTDPYHIRISYIERLLVNASGNLYQYTIPVNASLPLNNTPDLFYAQQGILRPVTFANITNVTSVVGGAGTYATSGNTAAAAYVYGTAIVIPSSSSSSATSCGSIPTALNSPPLSNSVIIVTYNAQSLNCVNSYGGLITYVAPSTPPLAPYLVYPSSSNVLGSLPQGTRVLLYGPGLDTLNIEGLRSDIINSYYFASPFTPSYLDRGQGNMGKQSPNGIFTFSNYNIQVANFPGPNGNDILLNAPNNPQLEPTQALTVSAWIYSRTTSGASANEIVSTNGYCGYSLGNNNAPAGYTFFICNGGTNYYSPKATIGTNSWHHLVGVFNGTNKQVSLYVDGNLVGTNSVASIPNKISYSSPPSIAIGDEPAKGQTFNGLIADVQIYSQSLTKQQIQKLYAEGISGLPIVDNSIVGWWPLDGNANDYSGYSDNGVVNSVTFTAPPYYTRDSAFAAPVPTPTAPLPGILCYNYAQCSSTTQAQLYLGYMPLEFQSSGTQVADLRSAAQSWIQTTNNILLSSNSFSLTGWFSPGIPCTSYSVGDGNEVLFSQNALGGIAYRGIELACTHAQGRWQFEMSNSMGGGVYSAIGNSLLANNWYFAALTYTYSNNAMAFYINGTLVGANTAVGNVGAQAPLVIGSGEEFFPGNVANVQAYSAALTQAQISQLYHAGIAGLPLAANGLAGWWPLDGNANDYSGFANTGTPANVVIYPFLSGNYNSPGLGSSVVASNEWQALGLANT
jgi:hypothetical protein